MAYREEKPLADLIPPDRRRQKTVALVAVGMFLGAGVLYALQQVTREPPPRVSAPAERRGFSATLDGPDGTLTVPARGERTVVHVWLQGCADCMPAFEAIAKIEAQGPLAPNVVNVAYGAADPAWAAGYGVRKNLVFDHGGARVVKPLGITSFTTIVFDEQGNELLRDRPDRAGYVERIRALVVRGPLSPRDVEDVVATKRQALREACWNTRPTLTHEDVTVTVVVGGDGAVLDSSSRGGDEELARCIEAEVKRWRFRATGRTSAPVRIPFTLRRDE